MSTWHTARFVRKGNYLAGSFIKPPEIDGYINSVNPGNLQDLIGKFPFSESSVETAIMYALDALPKWHRAGLETRMLCMHRYRDQLASHIELLASFVTRETGKPFWEAHSEVLATIKRIDITLEHGLPLIESWRLHELEGGCEYHPRGIVAVLGTHNLPLLTPNTHIIPCLLAGNVVIFKPSKYTPAVGQLIAEFIDRARFPKGVFSMIQGSGKVVGRDLATHPEIDSIHLEGSVETAYDLRKSTLKQPWKRLVLNSCGRGSAIVLEDADVDKAIHEVLVGALLTAGQRRSSTARVILHKAVHERFVKRFLQVLKRVSVGYGLHEGVFLGPLISEASRQRFLLYVDAMEAEGHEILYQGDKLDLEPNGYYIKPSLVQINPSAERKFLTSEDINGPAIELYLAENFEEAIAIHNQSRFGLVSAIFTKNEDYKKEAKYAIRTGAMNFNRSTISLSARLPLDGQFASGNGIPLGLHAIRSASYPMAFLDDSRPFHLSSLMPGITWPPPEEFEDADDTVRTESGVSVNRIV